ncbi:MAG: hypothetical protein EOO39_49320 [Cytophagaceae bacterium]|nr:MAG: hypothetical protein EOO39_49320 [Cytophagaceae bacterium]
MRSEREKKLMLKFWVKGGVGAMFLGSGLSVLLHGWGLRQANEDNWFWVSTGGFALIMTGLRLIGDANRHRTMVDVLNELDQRENP